MDFYKIHLPFWEQKEPVEPQEGAESHKDTLWLRPLRSSFRILLGPPRQPSVAICTHLRGSLASPPRAFGCLAELALSQLAFSVLLCCSGGGLEPLSARGEDQAPGLPAPGTSIHPWVPCSQARAVPEGASRRHLSRLTSLESATDRVFPQEACGAGQDRQELFSFLPQLVTQGSSVHGLSNKLTVELKHAYLCLSSLDLPTLCCWVLRTFSQTTVLGLGQLAHCLSFSWGAVESHWLCPFLPGIPSWY